MRVNKADIPKIMQDYSNGMDFYELCAKYPYSIRQMSNILGSSQDGESVRKEFEKHGCIECSESVSFYCKYGKALQGSSAYVNKCNYILMEHRSRGCPPDKCTAFVYAPCKERRRGLTWFK